MSRVYDRARRYGFKVDKNHRIGSVIASKVLQDLHSCQVISVDNVAQYWAEVMGGEMLWAGDLPNAAPPFPVFWIEYAWPFLDLGSNPVLGRLLNAGTGGSQDKADQLNILRGSLVRNVGVCCIASDVLTDPAYVQSYLSSTSVPQSDADCVRWLIEVTPVVEGTKNKPLWAPLGQMHLCIGHDGIPVYGKDGRVGGIITGPDGEFDDENKGFHAIGSWVMALASPALLAIAFMHCKNVRLVDEEPPSKLNKRHERKHGHGLTKYKTLEIDPMREILRKEGNAEKTGLERALHICRGHFKTFGGDKKLFGKYEGTYFWPQHIRGKEKNGRIEKDYAVKAPNA